MKYFDISGDNVVVHADALAIPAFTDIWNKFDDKSIATNIIKYIVLNNHHDSPYVKSMPTEIRKKKLVDRLFAGDSVLVDSFSEAEAMYVAFTDTLSLQMLRGLRLNIELMTKSLRKSTNEDMSFRDMKELLDLASKAEKAIKSIKNLEDQVRKDELETSTVRGGGKVGYYEIPRK
jgi:hypothetical protein